jgi:predicted transcriptional regulator of viral defense system
LKRGGRFFVGFDTAAGHLGWHPEAYGVVTIAMPRHGRVRPGQVEGSAIRTITVDDSTFTHGVTTVRWRDVQVPMSDRNRTVLDAVSRVDLIGGYPALLRLLERAGKDPRVDQSAVAALCLERGSVRLQKRLGFLSERAGWQWSQPALETLRRWPSTHRTTLDNPRDRPRGHWDSRWQLVVNVPDNQLLPERGIS